MEISRIEGTTFKLLSKEKFSVIEHRLLLYYLGELGSNEYRKVDKKFIASFLGTNLTAIYKATEKFVNKGILLKQKKVSRFNRYQLNTLYSSAKDIQPT